MKPTAALSVHAGQQYPKNTAGNKHVESIALTTCLYPVGKGTVQLLSGGITPCKAQLKTENTLFWKSAGVTQPPRTFLVT